MSNLIFNTNQDFRGDEEHWITINGSHVLLEGNKIVGGGGKLKGTSVKNFSERKEGKGKGNNTSDWKKYAATNGKNGTVKYDPKNAIKYEQKKFGHNATTFGDELNKGQRQMLEHFARTIGYTHAGGDTWVKYGNNGVIVYATTRELQKKHSEEMDRRIENHFKLVR